jgi:hypothetical protein
LLIGSDRFEIPNDETKRKNGIFGLIGFVKSLKSESGDALFQDFDISKYYLMLVQRGNPVVFEFKEKK